MYLSCIQNKKLWLAIMVIILIMWLCAMIGPGLIGASLFSFLNYASMGMFGFLSLGIGNANKDRLKLYFGLSVLLLMFIVMIADLRGSFSIKVMLGFFLPILGGACSFIYFKQSQALSKVAQFSATQVLAVRFYLTIIVLCIIVPPHSFSIYFTINNLGQLFILALLSLIVPLYFLQKALEKITSEQNAIIISLCPVMTAILQELVFKNVDLKFIIIYLLYSMIVAFSYVVNKTSRKGK